MVRGEGEVGKFEVCGALPAGGMGPGGQGVGVADELGDTGGGDESGYLGRTRVAELAAGLLDAFHVVG